VESVLLAAEEAQVVLAPSKLLVALILLEVLAVERILARFHYYHYH
jgi:hypothetical protein